MPLRPSGMLNLLLMRLTVRQSSAAWNSQPASKRRNGRVHMGDVAQHSRPETERVERKAVATHRGFGLGRTDDVVPVVLVKVLARLGDDLMQELKIGLGPRQAFVRDLFGIVFLHGALAGGERSERSPD